MAPKKQTPRQRKAEGEEAGPSPDAAAAAPSPKGDLPAGHGAVLVKLKGGKGPSDRVRTLIPALRFLFPGAKAKIPTLHIQAKSKEQSAALLALTDSSTVREAAEWKTLDNHAFLAALLDFAQDAAGVATTPRASVAALTLTPKGDAAELSSDVLYELGLYHDAWPLPLTAEGIKANNAPPSSVKKRKRPRKKNAEEAGDDDAVAAEGAEEAGEWAEYTAPTSVEQQQQREERMRRRGSAAVPQEPARSAQKRRKTATAQEEIPAAEPTPPSTKRSKKGAKEATEDAAAAPEAASEEGEMEVDSVAPQEPAAAEEVAPAAAVPAAAELKEEQQAAETQQKKGRGGGKRRKPTRPAAAEAEVQAEAPAAAAAAAAAPPEQEPTAAPLEPPSAPQEQPPVPEETMKEAEEQPTAPEEQPADKQRARRDPCNGAASRRASARQSKPLQGQLADISPFDDEEEEEEEAEEEGAAAEQGAPMAPRTARRPSSAGSRPGSRPESSLLTKEERDGCYWLNREDLAALAFRNKDERNNPPAPLSKEDLISCHDCQGAHVIHKCKSKGPCQKSYCQQCCRHYEYLFDSEPGTELDALKRRFCEGECPCCLEICARKSCLRNGAVRGAKKGGLPPPLRHAPADRRILALHVATCLQGPAAAMLADAEREAARQVSSAAAVHEMARNEVSGYRLLCNRCATTMENVMMHCGACQVDICPRCCADLAGAQTGALTCPGCHKTGTTSLQRALTAKVLGKLQRVDAVVDAALQRGDAAANVYDYDCKLWRLTKPGDERAPAKPRQSCLTVPKPAAAAANGGLAGPSLAAVANGNGAGPSRAAVSAPALAVANGGGPAATLSVLPGVPLPALANGSAAPAILPVNSGAPVLQSMVAPLAAAAGPSMALQKQPLPGVALPVVSASTSTESGHLDATDAVSEVCKCIPKAERMVLLGKMSRFYQLREEWHDKKLTNAILNHAMVTLLPLPELPREWLQMEGGWELDKALRDAKDAMAAAAAGTQQLPSVVVAPVAPVAALPQPPQLLVGQPLVLASELAALPPPPAPVALPASTLATGPLPLPPRSLAPIPGCIELKAWHVGLPPEDSRIAASRPDGVQNRIWTPHVSDFAPHSPRRHETVQRFVERWAAGEPIIIRGVRGRMNWGPKIVMRAARDLQLGQKDLDVIDCSNWTGTCSISAETFFNEYTACHGATDGPEGRPLRMLKLRDFPPNDAFKNKCVRHNADFIEMLNSIMPEYMHPEDGALNLAAKLPVEAVPPDLGPKGYIAFGREAEHEGEGDSVTRLHEDLSDAVNVMCHVQRAPGCERGPHLPARCGDAVAVAPSFGGAGALWDLFRRQDVPMLKQFIKDVLAGKVPGVPPFVKEGRVLGLGDVTDPVHDQSIMLTEQHRAAMRAAPHEIHPWVVEQYEHEAVLIPAACVHQVRNLRASIKIALDFVSPESVAHNLAQREERRVLARAERTERGLSEVDPDEEVGARHYHDKLQVSNMVVHGLTEAVDVLEAQPRGRQYRWDGGCECGGR